MQDKLSYKVKIDKEILSEFLLARTTPTEVQMKEVIKVFTVVLIKHYSSYLAQKEDLFSYAWVTVLERRKRYNESFSPYNFIYTIARNEIGNATKRYSKEDTTDNSVIPASTSIGIDSMVEMELPTEIKKFKKYLIGEVNFDILDLSPIEAFHLCAFVLSNTNFRTRKVPDFIIEKDNAAQILYKSILMML